MISLPCVSTLSWRIRNAGGMAVLDHLGVTIDDLPRAIAQWNPVLEALGYTRHDAKGGVSWELDGEPELILRPAREPGTGPHQHGHVGWQHLAFASIRERMSIT